MERIERDNRRDPDLLRTPEEVCLATFWRQATSGVSYYRCLLPARHLPGQMCRFELDRIGWKDGFELGDPHGLDLPLHRGTAIWSYLGDDARARVAFALQDQGIRTLLEVDDNYTQSPKRWGINWAETHQEAQGIIGYSHEQHRHLVGIADGVIVSTPHLAEVYGEYNDNIYLCRNSIEPDDWGLPQKKDDGILRIGYMGSAVHVYDFPMVKKALKWAARQKDVEVYTWGFDVPVPVGTAMPWVDGLDEFRKTLPLWDVGLAPLQGNDWNKSKSDIKAMEYAMAGALPVVSRVESYAPWWRDRGWPYVASTPEDWTEIIQHLVRNRDEVKAGAEDALGYVLAERTIKSEIHAWKEAVLDG